MYTFFRVIGYTFIILLILFGIIGLFASPESQFSLNEIIESPATIVWRTMIDVDRISEWDPTGVSIRISNSSSLRKDSEIDYYANNISMEIIYKERVTGYIPDRRITYRDIIHRKIPLQQNFIRDYTLKSLLDGSTELSITVHYTCGSFITRILDRIYLRGYTMTKYRNQLNSLRNYIENL